MSNSIADIRQDYTLKTLSESDVQMNPISQFEIWWNEAIESKIDEANAMVLSTIKNNIQPSSRVVLLKGINEHGFVFFTNYNSSKGNELKQNALGSLCFFWKELQRQVRIEGTISKISNKENDNYFNSRPYGSKVGAWASPQSQVIENREWIEKKEAEIIKKFGENIERPEHWGGYQLIPNYIEFWQGRANRLHDRICYTKNNLNWKIERLAP